MNKNKTSIVDILPKLRNTRSTKAERKRSRSILMSSVNRVRDIPYTIKKVPLRTLHFDYSYQRTTNADFVTLVAEHWLDLLYDPIIVNYRRSTGYVVDGATRSGAALKNNAHAVLEAKVLQGASRDDEALTYMVINRFKRQPTALELFKAARRAKEPISCGIDKVITSHGFHIPDAGVFKNNAVSCVGVLEALYTQTKGKAILDDVFTVIERAWGTEEEHVTRVPIVKGLGFILSRDPWGVRLNLDVLIKQAKNVAPKRLMDKAALIKLNYPANLRAYVVGDLLLALYNKGIKQRRKKVPLFDSRSA